MMLCSCILFPDFPSGLSSLLLNMFTLVAFTTSSGKLFHMVSVRNPKAFCLSDLVLLCRYILTSCPLLHLLYYIRPHLQEGCHFFVIHSFNYLVEFYHVPLSVSDMTVLAVLMFLIFLHKISFKYGNCRVHLCTFSSISMCLILYGAHTELA